MEERERHIKGLWCTETGPLLPDASRARLRCKTSLVEDVADQVAYGKMYFEDLYVKLLLFNYF